MLDARGRREGKMPFELCKKRLKGSVRSDDNKRVLLNYVFDYPVACKPSDAFREELASALEKYARDNFAHRIAAESEEDGFIPYSLFLEYADHGGGGEIGMSVSYIFALMRGNTLLFAHSFCENRSESDELLTLRSLMGKVKFAYRDHDFVVRGDKVFLYSFDAAALFGRRIRRSALSSLSRIEPI